MATKIISVNDIEKINQKASQAALRVNQNTKSKQYKDSYRAHVEAEFNQLHGINLTYSALKDTFANLRVLSGQIDDDLDNRIATIPRNVQVFGAVVENGDTTVTVYDSAGNATNIRTGASDTNPQNPHALQPRLLYNNPNNPGIEGDGLTPIGWLNIALWPFTILFTLFQQTAANRRRKEVQSYQYLADRLNEIKSKYTNPAKAKEVIQLKESKHTPKRFKNVRYTPLPEVDMEEVEENSNSKSDTPQEKIVKLSTDASVAASLSYQYSKIKKRRIKDRGHEFPPPAVNKDRPGILTKLKNASKSLLGAAFSLLDDFTSRFWSTWMFANTLFGFTAMTVSDGQVMIGVLAFTFVSVAAVVVVQMARNYYNKRKNNSDPAKVAEKPQFTNQELKEMQLEMRQRVYLRKEHQLIMKSLDIDAYRRHKAEKADKTIDANENVALPHMKDPHVDPNSDVYRHLTYGSNTIGLNVFTSFFGRFVVTVFSFWLFSAVAGVFSATASAFLGGPAIAMAVGVVLGIGFACKAAADMAKQKAAHMHKLEETLRSRYKNTAQTKGQRFDELYADVEKQKTLVANLRKQFANTNTRDTTTGYNIKEIDVYNDYLFEKQRQTPTLWTYTKKGLQRAYAFAKGGQTGIFNARFFFLATNLLVTTSLGITALTPPVFFAVAAVCMVAIGVTVLVKYHLDRKLEHQQSFLGTFDSRLQYLEYKKKEGEVTINALNKLLGKTQLVAPTNNSKLEVDTRNASPTKRKNPSPSGVKGNNSNDTASEVEVRTQKQTVANKQVSVKVAKKLTATFKETKKIAVEVVPEKVATSFIHKFGKFAPKAMIAKQETPAIERLRKPGKAAAAAAA